MASRAREIKVVLLGDTGVGKSSIVRRFVTDDYVPFVEATVGASFMSKVVSMDGQPVRFHIWDTAGQEKFHSLAPMYYRGAAAALVVYDMTAERTFETLQTWVEELRQFGPQNIVFVVIGNKSDLAASRVVSKERAREYAESIGAPYYETSALSGSNVAAAFLGLASMVPEDVPDASAQRGHQLHSKSQHSRTKSCC